MWMYAAFSQLLTFWYEVSLEIRHCLEKVFAQKFAVFFFFASVFSTFRNPIKKKKITFCGHSDYLSASEGVHGTLYVMPQNYQS